LTEQEIKQFLTVQYGIYNLVIRIVSAADNSRNHKGCKISEKMVGKYLYMLQNTVHLSILAKKKSDRINVNGTVLDTELQNIL
jgi:protocatechuate 3,4-dioxygenase beta subunit